MLRCQNLYYACSTSDRAVQFGSDPALFVQGVAGLVARHSVLADILGLTPDCQEPDQESRWGLSR